jgi:hypothetical protein
MERPSVIYDLSAISLFFANRMPCEAEMLSDRKRAMLGSLAKCH